MVRVRATVTVKVMVVVRVRATVTVKVMVYRERGFGEFRV